VALGDPSLEFAPNRVEGVADQQNGSLESLYLPFLALVVVAVEGACPELLESVCVGMHLDHTHSVIAGKLPGKRLQQLVVIVHRSTVNARTVLN
jgi:hypothetical protein